MLNESLRLAEFPDAWGYTRVTPIPKDGDLLDASNWRPISQMSIVGRLIEKAIHTQLPYFFKSYNILYANQHCFPKKLKHGNGDF